MIHPTGHIAAMSPYALAQLSAPPNTRLVSLSQNESLRAPSPNAIDAATHALTHAHLYPDPDWTDLRHAIAERHQIPPERILCSNGSMELIVSLAHAFCGPDTAILAPRNAYPFFKTVAQLARARFDTAPEVNTCVSVETLLDTVQPDTTLVFVANPGNPTGTRFTDDDLLRLRNGLRNDPHPRWLHCPAAQRRF